MNAQNEMTRQHLLPCQEAVMNYVGCFVNLPQLTELLAKKREENNPAICMAAIHAKLAYDLVAPLTLAFLQESVDAIGYQLILTMKAKSLPEEPETDDAFASKTANQSARLKDLINRPIEDLKLMTRSQNCLQAGKGFPRHDPAKFLT